MDLITNFTLFMQAGGFFMYLIAFVFVLGCAIGIERYLRYLVYDLNASSFMNKIQKLLMSNQVKEAIQHCSSRSALLPKIIKNGLKRMNQGVDQVQNAIDATSLEIIPMVEKRLLFVNLIANICTLLGLLGTINGLITAFEAVAAADPAQKAELLSRGISTAMNTTYLGLVCAILLMVFHAVLTAKSEKIISDVDQYSVKLLDFVGTMKIVNKAS